MRLPTPNWSRYSPHGSGAFDYVGQNWMLQNQKAAADLQARNTRNAFMEKLFGAFNGNGGDMGFGGILGGNFANPKVQSYTAGLVGAPSAGARSNANAVAEAANQRATTETGMTVAGGGYGSGRGALAAAGANRAAAGANARAQGAQFVEADFNRQQDLNKFNASQQQGASIAAAELQSQTNARQQALLNSLFGMFGG